MNRIGITMGDPAGVGPEVVLQALGDPAARGRTEVLVFGDARLLSDLASRYGWSRDFELVQAEVDLTDLEPGRYSSLGGRATMAYLEAGASALRTGRIDALVTGPIHKQALKASGARGQTEWLARYLDRDPAVMLLAGERLRVVLATTHIPLREVASTLTRDGLIGLVETAARELRRYFFPAGPRLAVAALNPHGEESGGPGREELDLLVPAVEILRERGVDIRGPVSGDVVFVQALAGRFDAVVALYHDQGLAPLKAVEFGRAVNVTLGLGAVRTSPDHGVAYDLARQGRASPTSMQAAIRTAVEMAARARDHGG